MKRSAAAVVDAILSAAETTGVAIEPMGNVFDALSRLSRDAFLLIMGRLRFRDVQQLEKLSSTLRGKINRTSVWRLLFQRDYPGQYQDTVANLDLWRNRTEARSKRLLYYQGEQENLVWKRLYETMIRYGSLDVLRNGLDRFTFSHRLIENANGEAWFLKFFPDGKRLAIRLPRSIHVYDTETGKLDLEVRDGVPRVAPRSKKIDMSHDGEYMAFQYSKDKYSLNELVIWNVASNSPSRFYKYGTGDMFAFHPARNIIAFNDSDAERIVIRDFMRDITVAIIPEVLAVHTLKFSDNGNAIACKVGMFAKQVQAWDIASGIQLWSSPDEYAVTDFDWNSSSELVALKLGNSVELYRIAAGGLTRIFTIEVPPRTKIQIRLSPDGTKLSLVMPSQKVQIWDTETGQLLQTIEPGLDIRVIQAEFSPNNQTIALLTSSDRYTDNFSVALYRIGPYLVSAPLCIGCNAEPATLEEKGNAEHVFCSVDCQSAYYP